MFTIFESLTRSLTENPEVTQLAKAIELLKIGYSLDAPITSNIITPINQKTSFKDPKLEEKLIEILDCYDDKLQSFLYKLEEGMTPDQAFDAAINEDKTFCDECGEETDGCDICYDCEEAQEEAEEDEEDGISFNEEDEDDYNEDQ